MTPPAAPALPVVALLGDFDAGPRPLLAATLARAGLTVLPPGAPSVTHHIHGARSTRLSSLLGAPLAPPSPSPSPSPALTHWTEQQLDALVRTLLGRPLADPPLLAPLPLPSPASLVSDPSHSTAEIPALARAVTEALASRDAPLARLTALARALAAEPSAHPALDHARASLLRDPRVHEPPSREALCRALTQRATPFALHALAEALAAVRAPLEARSFGTLAARGLTRFSTPSAPFALEYETPSLPTQLDAFARRVAPVELLSSGSPSAATRTTRVRIATLPAPLPLPPRDTLVALFAEAATRPRARVFLAGCTLPASLPRAAWTALLSPLGAP